MVAARQGDGWLRVPAVILLLIAIASTAHAQSRIALVIGNTDYRHTRMLPNAARDAELIAARLTGIGFAVTLLKDRDYRQMREAIRAIGQAAQTAQMALVYFAGHGLEVGGENWLLPVSATLAHERDLEYEAVALTSILQAVRGAARLRLVILDACRNNPLGERMQLAAGTTRSVTRGLGRIEPTGDTLVAYSARHGTLAEDGPADGHSPFAAALAAHVVEPGLDVRLMFGKVRDDVKKSTRSRIDGGQEPFIYGSVGGEVIALMPSGGPPPVQPGQPAPRPVPAVVPQPAPCDTVRLSDGSCLSAGSGKAFRDNLADGRPCPFCPEQVVAPAGSFLMGSPEDEPERWKIEESPQVNVNIGRPFAVGRFAVTRGEFATFVNETGHKVDGCHVWTGSKWESQAQKSWRSPGFAQDDRHPVVCVNWDDAKAYVAWLAQVTGKPYRLLSEAEREYVARAGTTTPFWWGRTITLSQANYNGNYAYAGGGSKGEYRARTVPVDSFQPNPWGLYNVHGNVWEWTEDCWNDSHKGALTDGTARTTGDCTRRVVRGGSWLLNPRSLRAANRFRDTSGNRYVNRGFRVGRTF